MMRTQRRQPTGRALLVLLAPGLLLVGCGEGLEIDEIEWPLTAMCTVTVTGKGSKDVENDYLPHVVTCENGSADTEALKAQAVAARTYLYYKAKSSGSICDGTSCQVYTCSSQPSAKHYAAVKATAGQVLVYSNVVICAFYVAGAKPSTSSCYPLSSDPDSTNTEKYVTYNEGKSGNGITQSTLGWVSTSNLYNRGCQSQNGSHCLSLHGKGYGDIVKFYYGADIQLVTATGSCVSPTADAGVAHDSKVTKSDAHRDGKAPDHGSAKKDGALVHLDGSAPPPADGYEVGEPGPPVHQPLGSNATGCSCELATAARGDARAAVPVPVRAPLALLFVALVASLPPLRRRSPPSAQDPRRHRR
jgi:hypothetical protein